MANIKSAKKRAQISAQENQINTAKKARIKTTVKKFTVAVEAKDYPAASELLKECVSLIDKASSDGIYHANTAARKVATLSRTLAPLKAEYDAANAVKTAEPEKKVKKAAAKKTTKE